MSNFLDLDSLYRERDVYPNPCDYEVGSSQIKTWLEKAREVRSKFNKEFICTITIKNLVLPYPRAELFSSYIVNADSIDNTLNPERIAAAGHTLVTGDIVEVIDEIAPFKRNIRYKVSATNFSAGNYFALNHIGSTLDLAVTALKQTFTTRNQFRIALLTTNEQQQLQDALSILSIPRLYIDFNCKQYSDINMLYTIDGYHPTAKFVVTRSKTETDESGRELWIHYSSDMAQTMRFKRNDQVRIRISDRGDRTIDVFNDTRLSDQADPMKQTMVTLSVIPYFRDNNYDHSDIDARILI